MPLSDFPESPHNVQISSREPGTNHSLPANTPANTTVGSVSDVPISEPTSIPEGLISRDLQRAIAQFRRHYPMGSVMADFVTAHSDQLIVRATIHVGNMPLGSAMAMATTIEQAEDQAKLKAIASVLLHHYGIVDATASVQPPPIHQPSTISPSAWPVASVSLSTQTDPNLRSDHHQYNPIRTQSARSDEPDDWIESMDTPDLPPPSSSELDDTWFDDSSGSSSDSQSVSNRVAQSPASSIASASDTLETQESSDSTIPSSNSVLKESVPSDPHTIPKRSATRPNKKSTSKKSAPVKSSSESKEMEAIETPDLLPNTDASPMALSVDLSDIIAKTSVELRRLGWTDVQGRNHLEKVYGKRSRQHLTDPELLDFLMYLEAQPTPNIS